MSAFTSRKRPGPSSGSASAIPPAVSSGSGARVGNEARRVLEVFRLAVAVVDAREDAEHLEMALQPHPFQRAPEFAEVARDRQVRTLRLFPVARAPVEHALLVPADEGIAQQ